MPIRTLLVDDEALAIQGLRHRLERHPDIEIVGIASNGREAIRAIRTERPDLVFLDIQMPTFDGFAVLSALADLAPPLVIFVTAYSDHAIRAFEAEAVDYLLKPVEEDRLAQSLDRVRARLAEKRLCDEAERLAARLAEVDPEAVAALELPAEGSSDRYERVISVRDQGQIFRVDVDSIEKIDAAGDYMCLSTADRTLVLRETMKDLERRLDPKKFQRVHRSTIVNLDNVRQVKPHTNGECFLTLASGATVKVSRSYREVVARFL
jgi:two-component system LytT family response regulator